MFSLSQMRPGQRARLTVSRHTDPRLLELGMIPGTAVTCLGAAPSGSPLRYEVRGAVIALRKKDADLLMGGPL